MLGKLGGCLHHSQESVNAQVMAEAVAERLRGTVRCLNP
jgi:hypothetical protein